MSDQTTNPVQPGWESLLAEERRLLQNRRNCAGLESSERMRPAVGVALSGGGIRSATFCLGLFQGLASAKRLKYIDYLSTVSGGGYFGGFIGRLFAGMPPKAREVAQDQPTKPRVDPLRVQREGEAEKTLKALAGKEPVEAVESVLRNNNSLPLRWLRQSGNYLTPDGFQDTALAAAVFTRNWLSILAVLFTTLLTVFLLGDLARALLDSWPFFHDYELWLQSHVGRHWWWTPWWFLPILILGLWVVPTGWAYWLTQAGDRRQFTWVAAANLLTIGMGLVGLILLKGSSFNHGMLVLGFEGFLALIWVFTCGVVRCSRKEGRHLLMSVRFHCITFIFCLLPALWTELVSLEFLAKSILELSDSVEDKSVLTTATFVQNYSNIFLSLVTIYLVLSGLRHLACLAEEEMKPAHVSHWRFDGRVLKSWLFRKRPASDKSSLLAWLIWFLFGSLPPLVLTFVPSDLLFGPGAVKVLSVWAPLAFLSGFYFLGFCVLRKDRISQLKPAALNQIDLNQWLRSKLSRLLTTGILVYVGMQFLALINMWGQTLYAYTMYAGVASLTGALSSLLGLSSLAPLARFLSMKVGGKNGGFRLSFRILALVVSVLLALSLAIVTSVISHGIAWRFGTPVITSKTLDPVFKRLQTEWNRNKSATLRDAFVLWTAPPQRSTNWGAFRELSNSPGARLSASLTNQVDVSLSRDGFIKIEHSSWAPGNAVPHRQMFLLDLGLAFLAGLALTFFFGRIVSFLNLSSLNSFYAARLIRAYLGATNTARWINPQSSINDVHPQDDLAWHKYEPHAHGGPMHLVNVTVNSTVSIETSMESKTCHGFNLCVGQAGLSFGHQHALWNVDEQGKRRSNSVLRPDAMEKSDPALGKVARVESLSLGKWVSISGAAFTTGLGQVGGGSGTSFGTSLLSGLFNVRLGYWWENEISPSSSFSFDFQLPTQKYLFDELIGSFHVEKSRRWYLSDGGHLENTAAYELIRRRVPFIIVSDAGADPDGEMNDVANLVRRVRLDFGAEIVFCTDAELSQCVHPKLLAASVQQRVAPGSSVAVDGPIGTLEDLRPIVNSEGLRRVRAYAALARISYPAEDRRHPRLPDRPIDGEVPRPPMDSWLLLIKPGITDELSADLLNYQRSDPDFPQQTTLDQFFDEAQWESYRKLGFSIAERIFTLIKDKEPGGKWQPFAMSPPPGPPFGPATICPPPPLAARP